MQTNATIQPYGDSALLVQWPAKVSRKSNHQVHLLAKLTKPLNGIDRCIPAYHSLLVQFQPSKTSYKKLAKKLNQLLGSFKSNKYQYLGKVHHIPVCYHPTLGLDLQFVLKHTGLSSKAFIRRYTNKCYHVFMMGFLPGFAYLGKVDKALECPRKPRPRLSVPSGAVGLASWQTGVYPTASPGGWQLIGQTPTVLFDKHTQTSLLQAGDTVRFYEISLKDYQQQIKGQAAR